MKESEISSYHNKLTSIGLEDKFNANAFDCKGRDYNPNLQTLFNPASNELINWHQGRSKLTIFVPKAFWEIEETSINSIRIFKSSTDKYFVVKAEAIEENFIQLLWHSEGRFLGAVTFKRLNKIHHRIVFWWNYNITTT